MPMPLKNNEYSVLAWNVRRNQALSLVAAVGPGDQAPAGANTWVMALANVQWQSGPYEKRRDEAIFDR